MKNSNFLIENTVDFVKKHLSDSEPGHDWWHIYRVWKMAIKLASHYPESDILVVELASLLHDIADEKFGDHKTKDAILKQYIHNCELNTDQKAHIYKIIQSLSFKKSFRNINLLTVEFQIVQDADRLDALGAIGIARAFSFGGHKNRVMYDPEVPPKKYKNQNEYGKRDAPTINHFYEKLFLLKDQMNTPEAKSIAEKRHEFMKTYIAHFYEEWESIT